jgi:porin
MKSKNIKMIKELQNFAFGIVLTACISVFWTQTNAAEVGGTAKKEEGKLSLTKVAPDVTPVSDYSGDIWNRSTLFGDVGGKRQQLYEDGIMFDASLTQVYQSVVSGGPDGDDNDGMYNGLLDYSLSLDAGKLGWWPGGLLVFTAQTAFAGDDPLEAGNISPPNFTSIYPTGEFPDTQLMEYYLMQPLSKDLTLIAGRINAVNFLDKNRFANDSRNGFLNLSMNNDPLFGAFLFFSTYGAFASWQVTDNLTINPAIWTPETEPGHYSGEWDEVGAGVEVDYSWTGGNNLGGVLRGTYLYTSADPIALDNPRLVPELVTNLPAKDKPDNWIVALNFEQFIWKPAASARKKSTARTASFDFQEPGIGIFARASYTPKDRNAWNAYASGGVSGRGFFESRPYDRAGVGVYWLQESSDLDNQPGNLFKDETGFEVFYNYAITPSIQLSVDAQWIDPGITSSDDTVVLGTRLFTQF